MTLLPCCPWCGEQVPLVREYRDSDPTFIYYMFCKCNWGEVKGFRCDINQEDVLCGYALKVRLDDVAILNLEVCLGTDGEQAGHLITLISSGEIKKIMEFKPQVLSPLEARDVLLKYKKLWAFS